MNTLRSSQGRLVALASIAVIAIAAACGGSTTADSPSATAEPTSSTTPAATTAPTMAPTTAPTSAATSEATAAGGASDDDQLALGREIFNKTAGGVGCAYCHGADGKGDGPSMLGAPPNRGATEDMVQNALASFPDMSFIKLTNDEIKAVVVYLAYLAEQP